MTKSAPVFRHDVIKEADEMNMQMCNGKEDKTGFVHQKCIDCISAIVIVSTVQQAAGDVGACYSSPWTV